MEVSGCEGRSVSGGEWRREKGVTRSDKPRKIEALRTVK